MFESVPALLHHQRLVWLSHTGRLAVLPSRRGILDMAALYVQSVAAEAVQPGSTALLKSALVWPLLILTLISFVGRGTMERLRTNISTELGILV